MVASTVARAGRRAGTVDAMTTAATFERRRFADELEAVGPDAPTLCEGWATRDLAAHVVLRERRPDAAAGVIVSKLSGYTDKVQAEMAGGDFGRLVERIRNGPPIWSPTRIDKVDRLVNTTEFFVHLEDVRRAQPDWTARQLDGELVDDLDAALRRSAKLFTRKAPAGVTLAPDGRDRIVANDHEPTVTVSGPVGELVLWIFGRQAHALVTYDGPADAAAALRTASFGL